MPLRDRPDFRAWLEDFESRHATLHPTERDRPDLCDGCGLPIDTPASSTGLCMVCLAETYGRERGQAAGRIAGVLEAAIARLSGPSAADVRDAVEEVLERYEREERARDSG